MALGLSIDPLKESISKAVEKTLAPQLFFTVIATGLGSRRIVRPVTPESGDTLEPPSFLRDL